MAQGGAIPRGTATHTEILSQPEIWREALAVFQARATELGALWQQEGFEQVVLTGCGSTYYAGVIGATLIQEQTGIPAQALPASEFMLFPQARFNARRKTLLITVSRSGATRETIEAARLFRKHVQGTTMTVTCHSESTLAQEADVVLAVELGAGAKSGADPVVQQHGPDAPGAGADLRRSGCWGAAGRTAGGRGAAAGRI